MSRSTGVWWRPSAKNVSFEMSLELLLRCATATNDISWYHDVPRILTEIPAVWWRSDHRASSVAELHVSKRCWLVPNRIWSSRWESKRIRSNKQQKTTIFVKCGFRIQAILKKIISKRPENGRAAIIACFQRAGRIGHDLGHNSTSEEYYRVLKAVERITHVRISRQWFSHSQPTNILWGSCEAV